MGVLQTRAKNSGINFSRGCVSVWGKVEQQHNKNMCFCFPTGGAISKPLTDLTVAESQAAVFECEVANPESDGQWLKNGRPLAMTDQYRAESDGVKRRLNIPVTKLDDMGEYSYEIASSKTSAKLKVEGQYFLQCLFFTLYFGVSIFGI